MRLAAQLMGEMLGGHAKRCRTAAAFVKACCSTMADWMKESQFRSGCPIATTMLETAPHSPELTRAGRDALDRWIAIVAPVFRADGASVSEGRSQAQRLIAAMEGALIVARVRQSTAPILDIAAAYAGGGKRAA